MADSKTHMVEPGATVVLADIPTRAKTFWPGKREEAETEFYALRDRFIDLQRRFYAAHDQKLLIVLQAMDCGGKDGATRHITKGVNPQGIRVESFKKPSHWELAHDYLWRVHKRVPANGHIGIFNRSHYGDVLVVRVDSLVPEEDWRKRYDQINDFERMLTETGTHILKFFLHISHDEQEKRLKARLEDPEKHWKFDQSDLDKREQWDDYLLAYEEALTRCSTEWAPWYVIPADQKWYRNLAIMQVVVDRLESINPKYPPPQFDFSKVSFV
jgi:PPK2 family polyphosphate:nucleotide phosphotransferase